MRGSAMIVVVIFLGAIVMFIFPLMATASQQDEIEMTTIQAATDNFANNIRRNGKLTQKDLDDFEYEISGKTGHMYAVDLSAVIGTEDPSKKTSGSVMIDGAKYYTMYNSQILQQLPIVFKEGDNISVTVTRVNRSIFEQLRDIAYKVTGNDRKTIASASGIITTNGY